MTTSNHPEPHLARPARRPRRRALFTGLALMLGAGVLSLSLAAAQAHGPGGDGPGIGGGGPGAFMAFRIQKVLDRVGASDSQKAQIKATWDGLRPQLGALHAQQRQLREQATQAMTAPTIDRAAVERLRQQSVQLMDKTSSLFTQGLLATAQVLTPDQRKQVAALMQQAGERHRGRWQHHDGAAGPGGDVTE